jgi:hypothetical protein
MPAQPAPTELMPLADPDCPACITFDDGEPACPQHAGTYHEGMLCPICGSEHVLVSQYGPRTSA